jgi:hypothetical protein
MRKYRGKYPNNICEVSGTFAPGIALVKTNNGAPYYIWAKDIVDRRMPDLDEDIYDYKFVRAQPMTFQQDVNQFNRVLDGYSIPFVQYLDRANDSFTIEELERLCRRNFVIDMAKQGILPRFTDEKQLRNITNAIFAVLP